MDISNSRIVALGGGTGLSTMLRGLKKYTEHLTAIVTVADDGGGSGMIREDLNLLPPGDIRNCLLALAEAEPLMQKLFQYRFDAGRLKGQSFGNLFLAAMCGISDNFEQAVQRASEVLAVTGRVLPVTECDVNLCARLENGTQVMGESLIPELSRRYARKIKSVFLCPGDAKPLPDCLKAIEEADLIILGPGSLYTSIIPNLLVEGIADAIRTAKAPVVYVSNIMTQCGESDGMSAFDHMQAISQHTGGNVVDYCIANCEKVPEEYIKRYQEELAEPVLPDAERFAEVGVKLITEQLLDTSGGTVRHDYVRLAGVIAALVESL